MNDKKGGAEKRLQRRIRILWCVLAAMTVYMIAVVEMGGGDSRIMSPLAQYVSRLFYFGTMFLVLWRIVRLKRILKDRRLVKRQMLEERDERNRALHEKSGGTVVDVLLLCLLIVTWTASLFHMAVFYTALAIFCLTAAMKATAYLWYGKNM